MVRIAKADRVIQSVDDWLAIAPPKGGRRQWKPGASAMELARAWFPRPGMPVVPSELEPLLTLPGLGKLQLLEGEPEVAVAFDDVPGEPRNCDLILTAESKDGSVAISVEAKAEEAFAARVGRTLDSAKKRPSELTKERASRVPERVGQLVAALFGHPDIAAVRHLRYQLLYATAAALALAGQRRAVAALFLVHEFIAPGASDAKHEANARDLDEFLCALSRDRYPSLEAGRVVGPLHVAGNRHIPGGVPLFIGKATRYLGNEHA